MKKKKTQRKKDGGSTISSNADYLKYPWKTESCGQPKCWCLMVVPAVKLKWDDGEDADYVVASGCVPRAIAKQMVELHNANLMSNEKEQARAKDL